LHGSMKNRKQISFQMGKLPSMMSWWRRHCEMATGYHTNLGFFSCRTIGWRQTQHEDGLRAMLHARMALMWRRRLESPAMASPAMASSVPEEQARCLGKNFTSHARAIHSQGGMCAWGWLRARSASAHGAACRPAADACSLSRAACQLDFRRLGGISKQIGATVPLPRGPPAEPATQRCSRPVTRPPKHGARLVLVPHRSAQWSCPQPCPRLGHAAPLA
jgi:hypothetical protein